MGTSPLTDNSSDRPSVLTERSPGSCESTGEDTQPVKRRGREAFPEEGQPGQAPKEEQAKGTRMWGQLTHPVQAVFLHCLCIQFFLDMNTIKSAKWLAHGICSPKVCYHHHHHHCFLVQGRARRAPVPFWPLHNLHHPASAEFRARALSSLKD